MTGHSIESLEGQAGQGTARKQPDKPAIPPERAAALLERALAVYERNFAESGEARAYLESRGITDAALFTAHRIGYSNGKLSEMLPGNGNVRKELNDVGILLAATSGDGTPRRERFEGCVTFPVFDEEGQLTTIYGRSISGKGSHHFLPGRSTGLWNAQASKSHTELILTESVIDALSVMVAGFANVIAIQGTNGLKDSDIDTLRRQGVTSIVLLLDGDEAGGKAAGKLRPKLEAAGLAYSILLVTDHATPLSLGTHTRDPVPFTIYRSDEPRSNPGQSYNENSASKTGLFVEEGYRLMDLFLGRSS